MTKKRERNGFDCERSPLVRCIRSSPWQLIRTTAHDNWNRGGFIPFNIYHELRHNIDSVLHNEIEVDTGSSG
jgi:hypothetical protein